MASQWRIHAYSAGFHRELARDLIDRYSREDDVVLDPFAGCATTVTEAIRAKRAGIGIDVDPIACLIARVSTRRYDREDVIARSTGFLDRVQAVCTQAAPHWTGDVGSLFSVDGLTLAVPNEQRIQYWFAPVQRVILAAATAVARNEPTVELRELLMVAISSAIIRKWPMTISLAMDIDHSRPHRVDRDDLTIPKQYALLARSVLQVARRVRYEGDAGRWEIRQGDATAELSKLAAHSVMFVLTSPPYVSAIDYPRSHVMAAWWLWPDQVVCDRTQYIGLRNGLGKGLTAESGLEVVDWLRAEEPAKYRRLVRYVRDMRNVIRELRRVLTPSGKCVLVLGNNTVKGKQVPVVGLVMRLLQDEGFDDVKVTSRQLDVVSRRYPYGLRSNFNGLMTEESVIVAG